MQKDEIVASALTNIRLGILIPIPERIERWLRNQALPEYQIASLKEEILGATEKEPCR